MDRSLVRVESDVVSIEDLLAEAQSAAKDSVPFNTARSYKSDWEDFQKFCLKRKLSCLPAHPTTVCAYLALRARTLKTSTLRRRLTTIAKIHKIKGQFNPLEDVRVTQTWRGIRMKKTEAQVRKDPLLLKDLQTMMQETSDKLSGLRDKALLLFGFAGALRRSELVAVNVDDLKYDEKEGIILFVRRSKTDQTGRGRKIGIPFGTNPLTCPVTAIFKWLNAADISEGAVFRKVNRHGLIEGKRLSADSVALIVKRAFRLIGKRTRSFSGHSLRAGLVTQAALSGASEKSIQDQTGHKSLKILRSYIRDANIFRNNAAKKAGL
jgi:site-specific recombinase XerD